MNLLDWAYGRSTEQEQGFAVKAIGYAMGLVQSQRMGESQNGNVYFGGAPVLLASMRDLVQALTPEELQ